MLAGSHDVFRLEKPGDAKPVDGEACGGTEVEAFTEGFWSGYRPFGPVVVPATEHTRRPVRATVDMVKAECRTATALTQSMVLKV